MKKTGSIPIVESNFYRVEPVKAGTSETVQVSGPAIGVLLVLRKKNMISLPDDAMRAIGGNYKRAFDLFTNDELSQAADDAGCGIASVTLHFVRNSSELPKMEPREETNNLDNVRVFPIAASRKG